jgi:hypothetical protein
MGEARLVVLELGPVLVPVYVIVVLARVVAAEEVEEAHGGCEEEQTGGVQGLYIDRAGHDCDEIEGNPPPERAGQVSPGQSSSARQSSSTASIGPPSARLHGRLNRQGHERRGYKARMSHALFVVDAIINTKTGAVSVNSDASCARTVLSLPSSRCERNHAASFSVIGARRYFQKISSRKYNYY